MAHHDSTPKSILNAPTLQPDPVWITTVIEGKGKWLRRRAVRPAFVGDVERDLLGSDRPDRIAGRRKHRAAANRAARAAATYAPRGA